MPLQMEVPFNGTNGTPGDAAADVLLGQPYGLYTRSGLKFTTGVVVWFKEALGRLRAMFTGQIRFVPSGTALPAPWSGTRTYDCVLFTPIVQSVLWQRKWLPDSLVTQSILYSNIDRIVAAPLVRALIAARRPTTADANLTAWLEGRGDVDVQAGDQFAGAAPALSDWPDPPAPGTRSWKAASVSVWGDFGIVDLRAVLQELSTIPTTVWNTRAGRLEDTAALWSTLESTVGAQVAALPRVQLHARLSPTGSDIPVSCETAVQMIRNAATNYHFVNLTPDRRAMTPGTWMVHGSFTAGEYWFEPLPEHTVLHRTQLLAPMPRIVDTTVATDNSIAGDFLVATHLPFSGLQLRYGDTDGHRDSSGAQAARYAGVAPPTVSNRTYVQTLRRVLERFGIYTFRGQDDEMRKYFESRVESAVRELQATALFPKLAQESTHLSLHYPARLNPFTNLYLSEHGAAQPMETNGYLDADTLEYLRWIILRDLRFPRAIQERVRVGTGDTWRVQGGVERDSAENNIWWWNDRSRGAIDGLRLFARDVSGMYVVPPDPALDLVEGSAQYQRIGFPSRWGDRSRVAATSATTPSNMVSHQSRQLATTVDVGWPALGDPALTLAQSQTFDVCRFVSRQESFGAYDVVQVYDDVFASMPLFHYAFGTLHPSSGTARDGEMAGLLAYLRHVEPSVYSASVEHIDVLTDWSDMSHSKGVSTGTVKVLRLDPSGTTTSYQSLPGMEERGWGGPRWFSSYHWFYRWIMMCRADSVRGHATWPGWRRAFWELAQIRLLRLINAAWPISGEIAGAAPKLGDVFKSRATLAMLLRWHVKAPGHIFRAAPGDQLYGRVPAFLARAVSQAPGIWGSRPYNTALWTSVHEEHLASAIRDVAEEGAFRCPDAALRPVFRRFWPGPDDDIYPDRIPTDWASRDFVHASPTLFP